jgi:putative Mg2+ transporter-C (MgtC) family protein
MSLAMSAADAGHLVVAVGLTYALGFERDLRGAPTGDRVFALIGAGSGVVGIIAAHGAPNALAGAITGVGFIGGGLLFRQSVSRSGDQPAGGSRNRSAGGSRDESGGSRDTVLTGITTAAAIFAAAAIGAAAGQGRLIVATAATLLALFVLEVRHMKVLNMLDGRRWAHRFGDDASEPDDIDPHLSPSGSRDRAGWWGRYGRRAASARWAPA